MSLSRAALRTGAAAAIVAAIQPWFVLWSGDPDTTSLATIVATAHAYSVQAKAMLIFVPAMFAAYWIASLDRMSAAPALASLALVSMLIWFGIELGQRSFDVWVVRGRWAEAYARGDGREALDQAYARYQDVLYGLVFVRRHALLVGQAALAASIAGTSRLEAALAGILALSVLRLGLGSLAGYGGWSSLQVVADPLYFVTAGLVFPILACWLWRRSVGYHPPS